MQLYQCDHQLLHSEDMHAVIRATELTLKHLLSAEDASRLLVMNDHVLYPLLKLCKTVCAMQQDEVLVPLIYASLRMLFMADGHQLKQAMLSATKSCQWSCMLVL